MTRRRSWAGAWRRKLVGLTGAAVLLATVPAVSAFAGDDVTPPAPFDIVADSGDYQTGYNVASPYNSIYVSWTPSVDDLSSVTYEVTVDGLVVRVVTDAYGPSTITRRVEVPDGSHVVGVTAIDTSGNRRDSTHVLDVVVDKVSPWFTSRPELLLRRGPVTSEGYPMRYTWTGDDEGTGLAAVRIGPDAECCYTLAPDLTQFDFTIGPRSGVTWRIFLVDGVGRLARAPRTGYVAPIPWNKTHHSDGWRQVADGDALDGSEWLSNRQGARFSVTAAGESVGWVTSTGPRRGRADVVMGGKVVDTVNLYSAERRPARVVWTSALPNHDESITIAIVNRSPAARPTIGVDALLLHAEP